mmetsp:Transcript_29407/g.79404  ORF Transcript_29407/g.79404 Transcript_29407/m.79404 type:complete len:576 (-) Transcript_29407:99-1826(-)
MTARKLLILVLVFAISIACVLALQEEFAAGRGSALKAIDAEDRGGASPQACEAFSAAGDDVLEESAIGAENGAYHQSHNRGNYVWPVLLPLTHSKVPVLQNQRVVAHKSVYYGRVSIGYQAQEFKVVFDTGSAHAIVASIACEESSCLKHRRYNSSASSTAVDVNIDGSWVPEGHARDTVTVGFGTGSVHADIVREVLCVSSSKPGVAGAGPSQADQQSICSATQVLVARQMSVLFETATFDGIVGLSFPTLALSKDFSFLSCLKGVMGNSGPEQFSFFFADDESGPGSELAIGGYNPMRLRGPLTWIPVIDPQEGHWKVTVAGLTINGETSACGDGDCEGIVDTGTSHLGVPREDLRDFVFRLSRPADENTDCRRIEGDEVVIQLVGLNITLTPWEYMRPLPLRAGTYLNKDHTEQWVSVPFMNGTTPVEVTIPEDDDVNPIDSFTCTPRLFPVVMKPGKKVFLLGEPVLQRYYSVFDWGKEAIAFGLADQRPQATSEHFDESALLQMGTMAEAEDEAATRLEPKFAVTSKNGLEDVTAVSLSISNPVKDPAPAKFSDGLDDVTHIGGLRARAR